MRIPAMLLMVLVLVGCGTPVKPTEPIKPRFVIVFRERNGERYAVVKDTKTEACFLVFSHGSVSQTMASAPKEVCE